MQWYKRNKKNHPTPQKTQCSYNFVEKYAVYDFACEEKCFIKLVYQGGTKHICKKFTIKKYTVSTPILNIISLCYKFHVLHSLHLKNVATLTIKVRKPSLFKNYQCNNITRGQSDLVKAAPNDPAHTARAADLSV